MTTHKEDLAQPEQEPVAITITGKLGNIYSFTGDYSLKKGDKVYTTPPQRKPLTFEQVEDCFPDGYSTEDNGILVSAQWLHDYGRAIEAAHGIKVEE